MNKKVKFLYDEHLDNPSTTIRVYNTNRSNDLIVKAFYIDDFHMSVTNQWSTGDSTIFKQLVDSAASMITGRGLRTASHYASKMVNKFTENIKEGEDGYMAKKFITGALDNLDTYAHASYFTADDFYKSFKGTTVSFPLNLTVTLVSDEMFPKEDIYQKLNKILDVAVGDYDTIAGGFIGMQKAPNDFKSGGYQLNDDDALQGTLKVAYGDPNRGGFILNHMLISNVHCTFSKTKVQVDNNTWRPLYIDVQIMLEPGKKFTKQDIKKNIGLDRSSSNQSSTFKFSNGKNSKEISENQISRRKELLALEQAKNKKVVDENIGLDFYEFNSTYSLEDGVLTIYGEVTPEEKQFFLNRVKTLSAENYPGVSKIQVETSVVTPENNV